MVLYGITLVPLVEELQAADLDLPSPFYVYDMSSDWSVRSTSQTLRIVMCKDPEKGYFSKPDKSMFIVDNPPHEVMARKAFEAD